LHGKLPIQSAIDHRNRKNSHPRLLSKSSTASALDSHTEPRQQQQDKTGLDLLRNNAMA
jgi:hypothetical protein